MNSLNLQYAPIFILLDGINGHALTVCDVYISPTTPANNQFRLHDPWFGSGPASRYITVGSSIDGLCYCYYEYA